MIHSRKRGPDGVLLELLRLLSLRFELLLAFHHLLLVNLVGECENFKKVLSWKLARQF